MLHLGLKSLPIVTLPFVVDFIVQRNELRVFFGDIAHDITLELAPEIEVFQPDEVGLVLGPLDDGRNIRDAGEDRGDEAHRADALVMEPLHGGQTPFNAGSIVHVVLELLVQGVDRPGNRCLRKCFQEVDIPQDQVRLGGDHDLCRCPPELFQQHPGALVSSLVLVVAVGDGADDDALPVIFVRIGDARPVFHIQERAPLFRMAGKALHKRGVTVSASVRAAHIWINGKSSHGQGGFRHDSLDILVGQRSNGRHDYQLRGSWRIFPSVMGLSASPNALALYWMHSIVRFSWPLFFRARFPSGDTRITVPSRTGKISPST